MSPAYLQHARRHLPGGTDPIDFPTSSSIRAAWANVRFNAIIEPTTARWITETDGFGLDAPSYLSFLGTYYDTGTRTDEDMNDYMALLPLVPPDDIDVDDSLENASQHVSIEAYAYACAAGDDTTFVSVVTSGVTANVGANSVGAEVGCRIEAGSPLMHGAGFPDPSWPWPPYLTFNPYISWEWVLLKDDTEEFKIGIWIDNTTADYVFVSGDLFAQKLDPPFLAD